jgi:hypothetical protein
MVSPRRPTQAHSRLRLMRITADLSALGGFSAIQMKKLKNTISPTPSYARLLDATKFYVTI